MNLEQNRELTRTDILDRAELKRQLDTIVAGTPIIDIHTHLFAPQFGEMNLFGIDELLTYHYLIAEAFRATRIAPSVFWEMSKTQKADLIWQALFVENTPLSEATRGVIAVLDAFGLDTRATDLTEAREFFASRSVDEHLDRILEIAGVSDIVMTNDPLDPQETAIWESGIKIDPRFHAALRMDRLLNDWPNSAPKMQAQGFNVDANLEGRSASEIRRFLAGWIERMRPLYMAVSLPDDFTYGDGGLRDRMVRDVVVPTAIEYDLPFAVMIGVRRAVNPALRMAGDGLGRADVRVLERMCAANPDVRFLATYLSRENQHELCVAARKFANLMPFGCWWFLNNASIVSEITRERIELLGPTFIPQHSDARVLDQLIYKWRHSRKVIGEALFEAYSGLLEDGRSVTAAEIQRDVAKMFAGNFKQWVRLPGVEAPMTAEVG
jgi:hypothetical protein